MVTCRDETRHHSHQQAGTGMVVSRWQAWGVTPYWMESMHIRPCMLQPAPAGGGTIISNGGFFRHQTVRQHSLLPPTPPPGSPLGVEIEPTRGRCAVGANCQCTLCACAGYEEGRVAQHTSAGGEGGGGDGGGGEGRGEGGDNGGREGDGCDGGGDGGGEGGGGTVGGEESGGNGGGGIDNGNGGGGRGSGEGGGEGGSEMTAAETEVVRAVGHLVYKAIWFSHSQVELQGSAARAPVL